MAIRRPEPRDLVVALAHAKADAIKAKMRAAGEPLTGYLLTCDQVCVPTCLTLDQCAYVCVCTGVCASAWGCAGPLTVGFLLCCAYMHVCSCLLIVSSCARVCLSLLYVPCVCVCVCVCACVCVCVCVCVYVCVTQVVVHEGRILEKPESHDEARQFINGYSRAPASTVGSVLCTNLDTNAAHGDVDVSTIHFSAIPQNTIDKLIQVRPYTYTHTHTHTSHTSMYALAVSQASRRRCTYMPVCGHVAAFAFLPRMFIPVWGESMWA